MSKCSPLRTYVMFTLVAATQPLADDPASLWLIYEPSKGGSLTWSGMSSTAFILTSSLFIDPSEGYSHLQNLEHLFQPAYPHTTFIKTARPRHPAISHNIRSQRA
jgi:hypothetical protein